MSKRRSGRRHARAKRTGTERPQSPPLVNAMLTVSKQLADGPEGERLREILQSPLLTPDLRVMVGRVPALQYGIPSKGPCQDAVTDRLWERAPGLFESMALNVYGLEIVPIDEGRKGQLMLNVGSSALVDQRHEIAAHLARITKCRVDLLCEEVSQIRLAEPMPIEIVETVAGNIDPRLPYQIAMAGLHPCISGGSRY